MRKGFAYAFNHRLVYRLVIVGLIFWVEFLNNFENARHTLAFIIFHGHMFSFQIKPPHMSFWATSECLYVSYGRNLSHCYGVDSLFLESHGHITDTSRSVVWGIWAPSLRNDDFNVIMWGRRGRRRVPQSSDLTNLSATYDSGDTSPYKKNSLLQVNN